MILERLDQAGDGAALEHTRLQAKGKLWLARLVTVANYANWSITLLASVLDVREAVATDAAVLVTVDDGAVAVAPLLRALDAAAIHPTSITVNRPTLDDVFLTRAG